MCKLVFLKYKPLLLYCQVHMQVCPWKKWDFQKLVDLRLDCVTDRGLALFRTVDP